MPRAIRVRFRFGSRGSIWRGGNRFDSSNPLGVTSRARGVAMAGRIGGGFPLSAEGKCDDGAVVVAIPFEVTRPGHITTRMIMATVVNEFITERLSKNCFCKINILWGWEPACGRFRRAIAGKPAPTINQLVFRQLLRGCPKTALSKSKPYGCRSPLAGDWADHRRQAGSHNQQVSF